jgi:endonuclease/exonuclease/phosphatase family metal-dependent hydrolase
MCLVASEPVPSIVLATWNVHSGVDGWGRPFDVVAGCQKLDADVLVLEETWTSPQRGSLARDVADALGYELEEVPIAGAVMLPPPPRPGKRWGPPMFGKVRHGPRVDPRLAPAPTPGVQGAGALDDVTVMAYAAQRNELGTVGLALLTRLDLVRVEVCDYGSSWGDPTRRAAIAATVVVEGSAAHRGDLLVVGTHLSHLRHGSPLQVAKLRKLLAARSGERLPIVLAGDMNLPGPVVSRIFPNMKKVAKGRTWPAWAPLGQPDHVLVSDQMTGHGEVVALSGSDHLPLRAELSVP